MAEAEGTTPPSLAWKCGIQTLTGCKMPAKTEDGSFSSASDSQQSFQPLTLCSFNNCTPSHPHDVFRAGGALNGESHLNLRGQNRSYFYSEGLACGIEHNVGTETDC